MLKTEMLFYLVGSCWGIFGGVMSIIYFQWQYGKEIATLRECVNDLRENRDIWRKVANDRLSGRREAAV
jgi:hypothetical protein